MCVWVEYSLCKTFNPLTKTEACAQITTTGKASLSTIFASYNPAQRLVVNLENAYRFCW
jgi:hypothetical protein